MSPAYSGSSHQHAVQRCLQLSQQADISCRDKYEKRQNDDNLRHDHPWRAHRRWNWLPQPFTPMSALLTGALPRSADLAHAQCERGHRCARQDRRAGSRKPALALRRRAFLGSILLQRRGKWRNNGRERQLWIRRGAGVGRAIESGRCRCWKRRSRFRCPINAAALPWDWESFPEYLARVQSAAQRRECPQLSSAQSAVGLCDGRRCGQEHGGRRPLKWPRCIGSSTRRWMRARSAFRCPSWARKATLMSIAMARRCRPTSSSTT